MESPSESPSESPLGSPLGSPPDPVANSAAEPAGESAREARPEFRAQTIRVLLVDLATGFYRVRRFALGDFFGPVDLGLHLAGRHNSLNIGVGLLAGSIFPGSNRLIVNGFSPCWSGFFVSSMGGAGLVFDNLGVNMISLVGRAQRRSLLVLNRVHGEEIQVDLLPVDPRVLWSTGRGGVYGVMQHALAQCGSAYETDPRILAVGPAAEVTDFGAIASAPIKDGRITFVDTWAGRGGLGSKLYREHGLVGVIYGGTFIDEDFRDRQVADRWFEEKYRKRLAAKDLESTLKYRFDPKFGTGGTFGVNFATLGGRVLAFNYRSIFMSEADRLALHERFIANHYLKQFNEETIATKSQRTCGEPCSAVCKKMRAEYKKDYEPYQTMGPLCGIFDQRAAELLNGRADTLGFDAISAGGVLAWLMECLAEGYLAPKDLGVTELPVFAAAPAARASAGGTSSGTSSGSASAGGAATAGTSRGQLSLREFSLEGDSMHNARLGAALLDAIIARRGVLDLSEGARKLARRLARERGKRVLDPFLYTAFARRGWMVPNQYWTPGVLSPMAIMGKYYMHYDADFLPPRELGRRGAERLRAELILDDLGMCRFHRKWAEEMLPEVMDSLWGLRDRFLVNIHRTASRINSRNASVYWESRRNLDFVHRFMERRCEVDGDQSRELLHWLERFRQEPDEAALDFWFETLKGIHESLREF